jgi:hypothetical protein
MQKVKNNKNKAQDRPLQSTAKKFDSGLTGGGGAVRAGYFDISYVPVPLSLCHC